MFLKIFSMFTLAILASAEEAMQSNKNEASDISPADATHKNDKEPPYRLNMIFPVMTKYVLPSANIFSSVPLNIQTTPATELTSYQEAQSHPNYEYAYSIEDHHTGDLHSHKEQRDGDKVYGQYVLHEADGTIRIVSYFDNGDGFNAVIEKQGVHNNGRPEFRRV